MATSTQALQVDEEEPVRAAQTTPGFVQHPAAGEVCPDRFPDSEIISESGCKDAHVGAMTPRNGDIY